MPLINKCKLLYATLLFDATIYTLFHFIKMIGYQNYSLTFYYFAHLFRHIIILRIIFDIREGRLATTRKVTPKINALILQRERLITDLLIIIASRARRHRHHLMLADYSPIYFDDRITRRITHVPLF